MRRLLLAALVLACVSAARGSASESAPGHFGIPYWKPVGSWVVLLLPLADGGMACTALTKTTASTSGTYSMGFALGLATTHFYLNDPALPKPAPDKLTLAVDGHRLAQLPVLLHEAFDGGRQMLMADVPGATLARRILPAMVRGRTLEVTAGRRHYTMPITEFASVVKELRECAVIALAKHPLLS